MNTFEDLILPFLRDLAANSLQASLLACIVALLCALPRRWLSPTWRHVLWCAVFARLVLPAIPIDGCSWNLAHLFGSRAASLEAPLPAVLPSDAAPPLPVTADLVSPAHGAPIIPVAEASLGVSMTSHKALSPASLAPSPSRFAWGSVAMVWLVGALAWYMALAVSWWCFKRRVLACVSETSPQLRGLFQACMEDSALRMRVRLVCSPCIATPSVCGLFRPVILIPQSLPSALPPHQLRLLLLHELGHLRRRDPLVQLLISLLLGLHWWNPVLWFAWSRLREEAEAATDAWVLRRTGLESARSYGAMLLGLASRACAAGASLFLVPSLIGASSQGRKLRQRLTAIVSDVPARRWAGLLGLAALALVAIIGFFQDVPSPKPVPEAKPIADKPASPAPLSTIIGGFVVDEQGQPINDAKIAINFDRTTSHFEKSLLPADYPRSVSVVSDTDGSWHLDGVPLGVLSETSSTIKVKDTYSFFITHPEFVTTEIGRGSPFFESASPPPDADFRQQTARLTLRRGHVVRGIVRDEQGRPIAGASVRSNVRKSDPRTTADAEGRYVLQGVRSGFAVLNAHAGGFAVRQHRLNMSSDVQWDVMLEPANTYAVKLRDEAGQPVKQARVYFWPVLNGATVNEDVFTMLFSNDAGVVVWNEAPSDEIRIKVTPDGYAPQEKKVHGGGEIVFTFGARAAVPVITLRVVSSATGKPLSGCAVDVGSVFRESREPAPRPMWGFGLYDSTIQPGATEGEYIARVSEITQQNLLMFRVRREGHAPTVTLPVDARKGSATIDVTLQERSSTPITVRGIDGSPAAKAKVCIAWNPSQLKKVPPPVGGLGVYLSDFTTSKRTPEFLGVVGEDGACLLPPCADDAVVLVANSLGYATAEYGDLIKSGAMKLQPYQGGEEGMLKLMLPSVPEDPPRARLQVRLTLDDKPLLRERVMMLSVDDSPNSSGILTWGPMTTDAAEFGAAAGMKRFQLAVRTGKGTFAFSPTLTKEIKPGGVIEVNSSLQPGIRLAGRVADEVPRPVKGAHVYVYVTSEESGTEGRLTWSDSAPLRDDGSFEFPSLPPGHVRLLVLGEGWISPFTSDEGGKNRPWSAGLVAESRKDMIIPMQRTAACDVTVVQGAGSPVSGAAVRMTAVFSPDGFRSETLMFDGVRGQLRPPPASLEDSYYLKIPRSSIGVSEECRVISDTRGHAIIRGLPPHATLGWIIVKEADANSRSVSQSSASTPARNLQPGETVEVTIPVGK